MLQALGEMNLPRNASLSLNQSLKFYGLCFPVGARMRLEFTGVQHPRVTAIRSADRHGQRKFIEKDVP